jgi:hypothetical protein
MHPCSCRASVGGRKGEELRVSPQRHDGGCTQNDHDDADDADDDDEGRSSCDRNERKRK